MCGDGAGIVNVPALKGIHYAIESGGSRPRRRSTRCGAGAPPSTPGALESYDEAVREQLHLAAT